MKLVKPENDWHKKNWISQISLESLSIPNPYVDSSIYLETNFTVNDLHQKCTTKSQPMEFHKTQPEVQIIYLKNQFLLGITHFLFVI